MSKQRIESLLEFADLIKFLKPNQLDCTVWKVLGGSPARFLKLKEMIHKLTMSNKATGLIIEQVINHVRSVLFDALNMNVAKISSNTNKIFDAFREKKSTIIPQMELVQWDCN